jgi:two-component sensor histidine kinase
MNVQAPAVAATPPHRSSLWATLASTFREAPKKSRWAVLGMIGAIVVLVTLQLVFDLDNGRGTWGIAESIAICLGISGIYLYVISHALEVASQTGALGEPSFKVGEVHVLHQMLEVSPVLRVVAGLLIGAGLGVNLVRALFNGPEYLVLAAAYLFCGVLLARATHNTTRFLYQHGREQAEAAARARSEATEAQLAALQAQIHPHYLFNALNTIAALVRSDARAAEATVENVAQVLRKTLDRSRRTVAPLSEEIDYLKAYLAVEKQRFGDRLRVSWAIAKDVLAVPVPPLVLQPLVENSLKHGLGQRIEGGMIEIVAGFVDGKLVLSVADDGAGLPLRHEEGTGLSNLRQRLATLYGPAASVTLEPRERGAKAVVTLPVTGPRGF